MPGSDAAASRRARSQPMLLCCMGAAVFGVARGEAALADAWQRAEGRPDDAALRDAVIVGKESNLSLYVCRARIANGIHIGRRRADFSACHIGYDGREVRVADHELLAMTWRPASDNVVPADSMNAGQLIEDQSGEPGLQAILHPCRAAYRGGIHIGEVQSGGPGCVFGYGGQQIVQPIYETLQAAPWVQWMPATSYTLPTQMLVGGEEGGVPMYLCRAANADGLRPGKVRRGVQGCNVVSAGREVAIARFEVLQPRWMRVSSGILPVAALPGGRESSAIQFPCRAYVDGTMQIGKASTALVGCHIGVNGREAVVREYEVIGR